MHPMPLQAEFSLSCEHAARPVAFDNQINGRGICASPVLPITGHHGLTAHWRTRSHPQCNMSAAVVAAAAEEEDDDDDDDSNVDVDIDGNKDDAVDEFVVVFVAAVLS
jgi:hypothetical protein